MNSELFPQDFLRLLQPDSRPPLQVCRNVRNGGNRATGTGDSLEFQEFRSYVPGDDPRDLDWNLFRRSRKLFLRRYRAQPEAVHRIVPDGSDSIRCSRSRAFTVWRVAALLGARLLQTGDRIRLEEPGAGSRLLQPGAEAVREWCEWLSSFYDSRETGAAPEVRSRTGERQWVISDFYLAPTLAEFERRWHLAAFIPIRIFEASESRLSALQACTLCDVEDGREITLPDDPGFAARYRADYARFESLLNVIGYRGGGRLYRIECTESVRELHLAYRKILNQER